jgi:hypothetical protein
MSTERRNECALAYSVFIHTAMAGFSIVETQERRDSVLSNGGRPRTPDFGVKGPDLVRCA